MQPNLYELLDVDRSAPVEDLKKAYRRQALKYHPDRNPDDPEAAGRFKQVTYAYQVLSDPVRRMQYDRFGRVFTDGRSRGPFGSADEIDLGEVVGQVFRDLFGGRRKKPPPGADPRDLRYTVTISLAEVAQGAEKEIEFRRDLGPNTSRVERLKVHVPEGVATGQKLKVRGKGKGAGDLYVVVNVSDHPYFQRRGQDVFCDIPVTYAQALLGAELTVPTLHGSSVIRLPAGTQPGAVLTLKGKGLPRLRGANGPPRGDQFVKTVLELPQSLDAEQEKMLLNLDRELQGKGGVLRARVEDLLNPTDQAQEGDEGKGKKGGDPKRSTSSRESGR